MRLIELTSNSIEKKTFMLHKPARKFPVSQPFLAVGAMKRVSQGRALARRRAALTQSQRAPMNGGRVAEGIWRAGKLRANLCFKNWGTTGHHSPSFFYAIRTYM